jgi:hypothetical protein
MEDPIPPLKDIYILEAAISDLNKMDHDLASIVQESCDPDAMEDTLKEIEVLEARIASRDLDRSLSVLQGYIGTGEKYVLAYSDLKERILSYRETRSRLWSDAQFIIESIRSQVPWTMDEWFGLRDRILLDGQTANGIGEVVQSSLQGLKEHIKKATLDQGKTPENIQGRYINPVEISKSPLYMDTLQKYRSIRNRIEYEEMAILTRPFDPNLHEPNTDITVTGNPNIRFPLHARVDHNLRILYLWDPQARHLRFYGILNHDEMDHLTEIRWSVI